MVPSPGPVQDIPYHHPGYLLVYHISRQELKVFPIPLVSKNLEHHHFWNWQFLLAPNIRELILVKCSHIFHQKLQNRFYGLYELQVKHNLKVDGFAVSVVENTL